MKKRRFMSVLLTLVMILSMCTVTAGADTVAETVFEVESQSSHFTASLDKEAYNGKDTVTVAVKNSDMTEAVVSGGIIFDPEIFTFVSAAGSLTDTDGNEYALTPELSADGTRVGFYYMTGTGENVDFKAGTMLTITFTAADTQEPASSVIDLYEDTSAYVPATEEAPESADEYQGEYYGATAYINLPGVPKAIRVSNLPDKTKYKVNEETLDLTGGRIRVSFEGDAADQEYDMTAEMVSGFDNSVLGTQTLTVTAFGQTTSFDVEIIYPDFAGGTGTKDDPYQVSDAYQLDNVRNYKSAYFIQTADIVFNESDFAAGGDYYNDGAGWQPIGAYPNEYTGAEAFTGTYDGNGYIVSGIYVNNQASYCAGLFGYNSGTIKNLGVLGGSITGKRYAGGIAGFNTGYITNCYNTAAITVDTDGVSEVNIGGITGCDRGGDIECCFNMGTVYGKSAVTAVAAGGIAGTIGTNSSTATITPQIVNCYNTGMVTASCAGYVSYAGGITGQCNADTYIKTSYSIGAVSGSTAANVGGIAGTAIGTMNNCYCLDITLYGVGGSSSSCKAERCTSAELQTQETFANFDFNNCWKMGPYFPELEGMPKICPEQTIALDVTRAALSSGGAQVIINASNSTNSLITWTSSDTSTATIEQTSNSICTVTAKASGTTVITAEADGCKAYCFITVGQKDINSCSVTLSAASYVYDGTAKTPEVTVKDGDAVLDDTCYDLTFKNNTHAGRARAVITGKGDYTGTVEILFTISKAEQGDFAEISSTAILTGGTASITCTGTHGAVSYETSDAGVATVSGGKVTAVAPGTVTIRVTAAGDSDYNEKTISFTITVGVAKVTISSVTNASKGITVSWKASAGSSGYKIYRSVNGSSYTWIKTVGAATTSYTDTGAANGKKYAYKIRAYVVKDGTTTYASYSSAKSIYRSAPATLSSVKNSTSGIAVTWKKVTGASGYYVWRSAGTGSYKLIKTITSGSTVTYKDTAPAVAGKCYSYKIQAYVNGGGTIYASTYSSVKKTYLLARPVISSVSKASSGVLVKWGKVEKATGYLVYRSVNGGSYKQIKKITSGSTVKYTDTAATKKGNTYSYKIYAYITVGGTSYLSCISTAKSVTK